MRQIFPQLSAFLQTMSPGYGALRALRNAAAAAFLAATPTLAEPLTLVALGDSLTQGYGLRQEQGFVPQLQGWLDARGADVTVVNAGVSGDTTAGGAARVEWSLTPEVDALIVNLGGNDLLRGLDPADSRANLARILDAAQARDLPVLLVGLRAPGNYGAAFKTAFDAMYPDLAAEFGADLMPNFFMPLIDQGTRLLARDLMQPDGIHPSQKGVTVLVEAIGPQVLDLLAKAGG